MSFTTARINAAIDTAWATSTHVQLHTGAPGGAGSSNVAEGVSRAALSKDPASGGSASGSATWTIPGAGGPFTHGSLWSASSGGTFCGDFTLSPAETFGGSGTLALTLTASGS